MNTKLSGLLLASTMLLSTGTATAGMSFSKDKLKATTKMPGELASKTPQAAKPLTTEEKLAAAVTRVDALEAKQAQMEKELSRLKALLKK